jgi:hypothetical protein
MNNNLENLSNAIQETKIVKVDFTDKAGTRKIRECIPFDYAYSKVEKRPTNKKFHFYDLDSPDGKHNLSLLDEQIHEIIKTSTTFNPADYINWTTDWTIKRDWGNFS